MNFKILRIGENEYSWNDLIYFLLFLLLIIMLHRTYPIELIVDNFKKVLSIKKTKSNLPKQKETPGLFFTF